MSRIDLLEFVSAELLAKEAQSPHRIKPIHRLLNNQKEDLLRFVEFLDQDILGLAYAYDVDLHLVRQVFELQAIPRTNNLYWEKSMILYRKLGGTFYAIETAIRSLIEDTVRASSVVENLNSRLRNYFFLRKTLSNGYLELLQFFLNHRRFMRSARAERVGKSPKELLTGEPHPHWLELLGYSLFKRPSQRNESFVEKKLAA